jgi:hypothetical protein
MHPFWSSHKEKRDCVRLSMEAVMAEVGAPLMVPWQACGRGGGGGGSRGRGLGGKGSRGAL